MSNILNIWDANTQQYVGIPAIKGDPGVHYGTSEPTDPSHPVWIDPSGEGDTSVQGSSVKDWNQNDPDHPEYIKNRPFYTSDPQVMFIMPEETLAFSQMQGMYMAEKTLELEAGKTYTVKWDGVEYSCECKELVNVPALLLGNGSPFGLEDTGEPFVYMSNPSLSAFVSLTDTSAQHTISVSVVTVEDIKIPRNYLPVATDDEYGVVKKSEVANYIELPRNLPRTQLIEAVEAVEKGAFVRWDSHIIIKASLSNNNENAYVRFADEPYATCIYRLNEGTSFFTTGLCRKQYEEIWSDEFFVCDNDKNYKRITYYDILPTAYATMNGQIAQVVNGKWAAVSLDTIVQAVIDALPDASEVSY